MVTKISVEKGLHILLDRSLRTVPMSLITGKKVNEEVLILTSRINLPECNGTPELETSIFKKCDLYVGNNVRVITDTRCPKTPLTEMGVYELQDVADFGAMLKQLYRTDPPQEIFNSSHFIFSTWTQIVQFVKEHRALIIENDGYGTFFPFKNDGRLLVACVAFDTTLNGFSLSVYNSICLRPWNPHRFKFQLVIPHSN